MRLSRQAMWPGAGRRETIPWPWLFVRPFIGPRVAVRFGKPFYPPKVDRVTSAAAKAATDDIMLHVAELLPEAYRGEYRERIRALQPSTASATEVQQAR